MKLNKKLKIAIVSDAIYPYNKGGKEKRWYEISTRLAKKGYEVHIYCMKWWKGKEQIRIENGVFLHAISKYYSLYAGNRRSIKQAIMFSLACLKLIKENFDVIDVDHMPHIILFPIKIVCLIKRKKLIATWNEVWGKEYWKEYLGKLGLLAYMAEWLSTRMPDEIIAVSEFTKIKLHCDMKVKQPIHIILNGIDLPLIKKTKPASEKSDVIYAGRLLKHKNIDVLIESINSLIKYYPNVKALIIGEGPEKNKLKKLITKNKLENNIKLINHIENQSDLYSLFKSSKVFVHPSTREGFGIVVLEANACGLPVVTTDDKNNASKNLIRNGINGYITSLDKNKISELLLKLLNGKPKSIKIDSNYDYSFNINQLENIYLRISNIQNISYAAEAI